jgi:uncharacterized Zn finger protein (UPF0148 family)
MKKISGSGKNLEGLEWSNLLDDYCPKCDAILFETMNGFYCKKCGFEITRKRYEELKEELRRGDNWD